MARFPSSDRRPSNVPTYQAGIAQAAAHRALNRVIAEALLPEDLTPMQWFALGMIYDAGSPGIQLTDLRQALDTTLPYITTTVALLEEKNYVRKVPHPRDNRIKLASVIPSQRRQVERIEARLHAHLSRVLYREDRIAAWERQTYDDVLGKLARYAG
jgi:DNA-binding MarR family transcriptional regulator